MPPLFLCELIVLQSGGMIPGFGGTAVSEKDAEQPDCTVILSEVGIREANATQSKDR